MTRSKQLCRLCCYETTDTVEIFSEKGLQFDYKSKINRYLYLKVSEDDDQPKTVCWMCSQNLETFHRFYEKINEIQQSNLKENYQLFVLQPIYHDADADGTELLEIDDNAAETEHCPVEEYKADTYAQMDESDSVVEVLVLDSIQNQCFQTKDVKYLHDHVNHEHLMDMKHIIVDKTNAEASEQDDVQTYVIFDKQTAGPTAAKEEPDEPTAEAVYSDDEIDPIPMVVTDDEIVANSMVSTDDEIVPIPVADNDDFDQPDNVGRMQVKTPKPVIKTRSYKRWKKLIRKKGDKKAEANATIIAAKLPMKHRRSSRTSAKIDRISKVICGTVLPTIKATTSAKIVKNTKVMDDSLLQLHPVMEKSTIVNTTTSDKIDTNADVLDGTLLPLPLSPKSKKKRPKLMREKHSDIPMHEPEAGDSDDEFPARDSDNEDWPAQQTLNEFPKIIVDNGLLLVKGRKLMTLICKFYHLNCELCTDTKLRFRQLNDLFAHYTQEHNVEGYVMCCQMKLARYPAIIMHMARHLQPDAFRCNVCGYMVTRPRFLESHIQTHLPEEQKPFGCDQCSRRFCWKGALNIHMISHQPADERKQYICHICGKRYDKPGGLSTHKKLIHTQKPAAKSNVCHLCAKNFATRTNLHEHMSTIHQPREKDQQQCTECGKWLMNVRCLKSHMILHSDVEFRCDICDYVTKKQQLLKRHLQTQHSNDTPFKCDMCNKSFKLKRGLTVHMAKHNSVKTHRCTFCDRVFNSSTNFYTHRKQMHPKQLFALKQRKLEIQRQKRILAGREEGRIIEGLNLEDPSATDRDNDDVRNEFNESIHSDENSNDNAGLSDDEQLTDVITMDIEDDKSLALIPVDTGRKGNAATRVYSIQTQQNVVEKK